MYNFKFAKLYASQEGINLPTERNFVIAGQCGGKRAEVEGHLVCMARYRACPVSDP